MGFQRRFLYVRKVCLVKSIMKKDGVIVFLVVVAAAVSALFNSAVEAATDHESMAKRMAKMRGDVEDLTADVDAAKEELTARLRSYSAQKADLEMEIQRAQMVLRQLGEAKEKRALEVGKDAKRDDAIRPAVLSSMGLIRNTSLAGLPFKLEERKADFDRLIRQMDEGILRPTDAVGRLWDRVEDELRLSRENGLYRQVIDLDGEEMLVDIARIGMMMMFYKTRDGRVGRTAGKRGSWKFVQIRHKEEKERVWSLFDSFKKQIRVGFFILPGALPSGGAR